MAEYLQNISDHVFATYSYLNEGDVTDHHRDGYSPQIWLRGLSDSREFSLSAGVGPYRYYDTTSDQTGQSINDHGWGALLSVAANWYPTDRWIVQLRYNRAQTWSSISTNTLLIGAGYQLDVPIRPGPIVPTPRTGLIRLGGMS